MGQSSVTHDFHNYSKASLVAALILGALIHSATAHGQTEEVIDRVAAIVDGQPILYSDIQDKVIHGPLVVVSDFPATEKSTPFEA